MSRVPNMDAREYGDNADIRAEDNTVITPATYDCMIREIGEVRPSSVREGFYIVPARVELQPNKRIVFVYVCSTMDGVVMLKACEPYLTMLTGVKCKVRTVSAPNNRFYNSGRLIFP
jgi:hypothetical protein